MQWAFGVAFLWVGIQNILLSGKVPKNKNSTANVHDFRYVSDFHFIIYGPTG